MIKFSLAVISVFALLGFVYSNGPIAHPETFAILVPNLVLILLISLAVFRRNRNSGADIPVMKLFLILLGFFAAINYCLYGLGFMDLTEISMELPAAIFLVLAIVCLFPMSFVEPIRRGPMD